CLRALHNVQSVGSGRNVHGARLWPKRNGHPFHSPDVELLRFSCSTMRLIGYQNAGSSAAKISSAYLWLSVDKYWRKPPILPCRTLNDSESSGSRGCKIFDPNPLANSSFCIFRKSEKSMAGPKTALSISFSPIARSNS